MKNGVAYAALQQMGARITSFGTKTEQFKEAVNNPGAWCPQRGAVFGGDKVPGEGSSPRQSSQPPAKAGSEATPKPGAAAGNTQNHKSAK